ncbi:MAG: DUF202 domain-containing protein [Chlorobi bacterium]|nr:DUF202 domain-containing protein [Chlorobiota bacterium]
MSNKQKLTTSEKLAIDRTKLANERTLLAFFRTFVAFISSGLAIINLDFLEKIYILGVSLMFIGIVVFAYGAIHYIKVNKKISTY